MINGKGLMTDRLQSLKAQATDITGLSDFGSPWFEAPLSAWIADLGGPLQTEAAARLFERCAPLPVYCSLDFGDPGIGPVGGGLRWRRGAHQFPSQQGSGGWMQGQQVVPLRSMPVM